MSETSDQSITARLGFLVYRLHLALREAFEDRLAPDGITPGDWGVLAHVREQVDTPAGLADCLGVDRAAVTRAIDRLEAAGLVARTANADDGRSVFVTLTPAGRQTAERAAASSDRVTQEYTAGLTTAERAQLVELLGKTIRTMPGRKRSPREYPEG